MVPSWILAGSVVLLLAVIVAAWYLGGFWHDLRTNDFVDPDYFIRPPFPISQAAERIIRVSALVVIVAAGSLLTWASVQHSFDLRWWSVLGPLVAAAALIGFAWRIFTAQVIGANIGAGCLIIFGGPVLLALLWWAVTNAISLTLDSTHGTRGSPVVLSGSHCGKLGTCDSIDIDPSSAEYCEGDDDRGAGS